MFVAMVRDAALRAAPHHEGRCLSKNYRPHAEERRTATRLEAWRYDGTRSCAIRLASRSSDRVWNSSPASGTCDQPSTFTGAEGPAGKDMQLIDEQAIDKHLVNIRNIASDDFTIELEDLK